MSNRWLMREERNDVPDAKHLEKVFHVKHERVCRNSVLTTGLQVFVVNFDDASPAPRADSADPHSNEVEGEVAIGDPVYVKKPGHEIKICGVFIAQIELAVLVVNLSPYKKCRMWRQDAHAYHAGTKISAAEMANGLLRLVGFEVIKISEN